MQNPSRFLLMRGEHSALSSPRRQVSSSHQQHTTKLLPFQPRHINLLLEGLCFKILRYHYEKDHQKQQVESRCNLQIEYIPQFEVIAQNEKYLTVKIKQYADELMPWLIEKDSLFKVTTILKIYIAYLQLIDVYGVFPLELDMMRVNQKQQAAIWFSSNYQLIYPPQTTPYNNTSIKQFICTFIQIFKCCLPTRWVSQTQTQYSNQNELLVQLTKLERKQKMHKNCHQFIKHGMGIKTERKIYNRQRIATTQSRQGALVDGQGKLPSFKLRKNQLSLTAINNAGGLRSQREIKKVSFEEKINQKARRNKRRSKSCFEGYFTQTKFPIAPQTQQKINKELSICSTGDLFKQYLLFNTLKNRRMGKLVTFNSQVELKVFPDKSMSIFRQQGNRLKGNAISGGNSPLIMSQKLILSSENEKYSPIKFRKFSSNTTEKNEKQEAIVKQRTKPGWHHKRIKSSLTCKENQDDITRREQKQKLQNSFPLKTASTLTSFRLSNQHQQLIASNKSQQSLALSSAQYPGQPKQKDNKIQEMKIEQQNELQNQLNNIFSMRNSKVKNDEHQKQIEKIITEFQQILF